MMWNRVDLKKSAKAVLKQRYWIPFLVSFIAGFLGGDSNFGGVSYTYSSDSYSYVSNLYQSMSWNEFLIITSIFLGIILVVELIIVAYITFLSNPIAVGKRRFYMENIERETAVSKLFFSFSKSYLNIIKVMFMQKLFIYLWSLLFIIPGIIKSYQYRMVPFILSENPDMPWRRALELSREMTNNDKWEIFVLDLSFWGWMLLGILTCCIGLLFVQPYIDATYAQLYQKMRDKAFFHKFSTVEELPGYNP